VVKQVAKRLILETYQAGELLPILEDIKTQKNLTHEYLEVDELALLSFLEDN
jgi:hypothetical protein